MSETAKSTILLKRLRRYLDAAWAAGAFGPEGSLAGLSADAIADRIAAEWDHKNRYAASWLSLPGPTPAYPEDLLPHVAAWMEHNL